MTRHEELLEQYARELNNTKELVERWWVDLDARETQDVGSPDLARGGWSASWPAGPASHPRVLAVVRKYWLACEALNKVILGARRSAQRRPEREYTLALDEEAVYKPPEDAPEEEVYPHLFVHE